MTSTTITRLATDRQLELIRRLATERSVAGIDLDQPIESLTTVQASALIDALFAAPRLAAAANRPAPGFYVLGTEIVRVQLNQAGTNVYAKRLVPSGTSRRGAWEYVPGLIDRLAGAVPATAADLAAYGHATGTCGICGALLTNPESIERGIGPICAGRL